MVACVGVFWWELPIIMQSWDSRVLFHALDVHVPLLCLNCSAGCPWHGAAISTWICMCLLHNWTAEGKLAWDWWSGGIMRKAPLFVGPLVHRDLTLWGLACVGWGYCPSFFPPPFFAVLHSHAPERGKKVAFHSWTCTGTHWGGEPASWLQLPFMRPSHSPATCMSAAQWLAPVTSSLKVRSACTAGMAALLSCCNFVQTRAVREWQCDFLWGWVKYWL